VHTVCSTCKCTQHHTQRQEAYLDCTHQAHIVIHTHYAQVDANVEVDKATTDTNLTAMHTAALEGHSDVVRALAAANADINKVTTGEGMTALFQACCDGRTDVVRALVDANGDVNKPSLYDSTTPLDIARTFSYTDIEKILLEANAKAGTIIAPLPSTDTAETMSTSVATVAECSSPGETKERRSSPPPSSPSPSLSASSSPPPSSPSPPSRSSSFGVVQLLVAALNNRLDVVESLMESDVDVNAVSLDTAQTALHLAALKGNLEVATALLAGGADVAKKDKDGATPLDVARRNDHRDVEVALIEASTDKNLKAQVLVDKSD
jgi:ankyrin repeat protein